MAISLSLLGCIKPGPSEPTISPTITVDNIPSEKANIPCEERIGAEKDRCFFNESIISQNPNLCKKIQGAPLITQCYTTVASTLKIYDICDNIEFDPQKYSCYSRVAQAKLDSSICLKIPDSEIRNECQNNFADPSTEAVRCNAISLAIKRNECLLETALRLNQSSICLDVLGPVERDDCRRRLAEKMGYLSICDEIENKDRISNCYIRIAILKNDLEICSRIIEPLEGKSLCLTGLANATNNSAICSKVPLESYKNSCISLFTTVNTQSLCSINYESYNPEKECQQILDKKFNPQKCSYNFGPADNSSRL